MDISPLMSGFPANDSHQVTLANWRTAPFLKWAFQHVRELVPTADIPNAPDDVWQLATKLADFSAFSFTHGAKKYSLDQLFDATDTDGLIIVHRGEVVLERYGNGMTANTPHILMSVSKSLTAIVAGILADRGALKPDQKVVSIIPELKNSVYSEATIQQVLDMRVGLAFDEDYLATSGPIIEYRKSTNWNPLDPGELPSDLRRFLAGMKDRVGPDGGPFHYVSTNTDLLGWVLERATGIRFATLLSDLLWKPMGAQASAYVTVDRLGAPRCAGGICTTLLDLARVGQLMVDNGKRNSTTVIPSNWIIDTIKNGDSKAWHGDDLVSYLGNQPMHYRNMWYLRKTRGILFGLGVFGQNIFVDPSNEIVIAKVSCQAPPLDKNLIELTNVFVEAAIEYLAAS